MAVSGNGDAMTTARNALANTSYVAWKLTQCALQESKTTNTRAAFSTSNFIAPLALLLRQSGEEHIDAHTRGCPAVFCSGPAATSGYRM